MRTVGTHGTRLSIRFARLTRRQPSLPKTSRYWRSPRGSLGTRGAASEARERAHAGFLEQGDKCRAAEAALELANDHLGRLETAIGNGWLGRARRLLEQTLDECAAHGWQALTLGYLALRITGNREEALRQAPKRVVAANA